MTDPTQADLRQVRVRIHHPTRDTLDCCTVGVPYQQLDWRWIRPKVEHLAACSARDALVTQNICQYFRGCPRWAIQAWREKAGQYEFVDEADGCKVDERLLTDFATEIVTAGSGIFFGGDPDEGVDFPVPVLDVHLSAAIRGLSHSGRWCPAAVESLWSPRAVALMRGLLLTTADGWERMLVQVDNGYVDAKRGAVYERKEAAVDGLRDIFGKWTHLFLVLWNGVDVPHLPIPAKEAVECYTRPGVRLVANKVQSFHDPKDPSMWTISDYVQCNYLFRRCLADLMRRRRDAAPSSIQ